MSTITVMLAALCASAVAGFRIKKTVSDIPYGPIPALVPVGMSLHDGLMLKNGHPYF